MLSTFFTVFEMYMTVLYILFVFRSVGDGNCLFRSASIAVRGDQSLHEILRILTCLELYNIAITMHFTSCTKKNFIHTDACLQQKTLFFSASVSDAIILAHFLATQPNKSPNDRVVCIKKQAEYICELKQYAPLVCFFALYSV